MAVKTKEETTIKVGNGNGAAAKVKPETTEAAEVPESLLQMAQPIIDNYVAHLEELSEAHALQASDVQPEMGGPVLAGGYQYWNCLTAGPYQFFGNPPYRPSKIIAAGEWTLVLGVVWVNPANGPGGSLPGTIVLGDRDYRVRFEGINLSTVQDGPDRLFTGTFGSPANVVSVFAHWFRPGDPGLNPHLIELNMTADIVQTGQPMAAFSTWHFDPDQEPGFLGRPAMPAGWQHEKPMRFLVYRK